MTLTPTVWNGYDVQHVKIGLTRLAFSTQQNLVLGMFTHVQLVNKKVALRRGHINNSKKTNTNTQNSPHTRTLLSQKKKKTCAYTPTLHVTHALLLYIKK
mmetsp:Transcript_12465/g.13825  ORF Transcript_12465/g.13825 Transcript_12465/m.13825 type:complete len:100 (-) Transcript_12465:32-331(-)